LNCQQENRIRVRDPDKVRKDLNGLEEKRRLGKSKPEASHQGVQKALHEVKAKEDFYEEVHQLCALRCRLKTAYD
jgi:hypothetical protein